MAASLKCDLCQPIALPGLEVTPPRHCQGRSDRPAPEGVLGGVRCSCPCRFAPHELHAQAQAKFPGNREAARAEYVERMKEAGHIIDAQGAVTVDGELWPHPQWWLGLFLISGMLGHPIELDPGANPPRWRLMEAWD